MPAHSALPRALSLGQGLHRVSLIVESGGISTLVACYLTCPRRLHPRSRNIVPIPSICRSHTALIFPSNLLPLTHDQPFSFPSQSLITDRLLPTHLHNHTSTPCATDNLPWSTTRTRSETEISDILLQSKCGRKHTALARWRAVAQDYSPPVPRSDTNVAGPIVASQSPERA